MAETRGAIVRAAVNPALGAEIRRCRLARKVRLGQLAAAAGVSASALSQIERGRIYPSVATLRRIAAGLEVPVFGLTHSPDTEQIVVRADQRKSVGLPGSPVVYQLLSPNLQGKLEVLYYEIEVGGVTFEGGASHAGEECCYILEGHGRLELDGRNFDLGPGDAATYASGLRHALRNIGTTRLVALSAVTPPNF